MIKNGELHNAVTEPEVYLQVIWW